jgi:Rps23 Pro-64 3,4-dihydroxylase Tpa1-like proline 4-hydroxylase
LILNLACKEFPGRDWRGWTHSFEKNNEFKKYACTDPNVIMQHFPNIWRLIEQHLSSAFVAGLEQLTGIQNLIADKSLKGGGIHLLDKRGHLDMHVDFNRFNNLYRRVNVLVYLNKDWNELDGGNLVLWDKTKIIPTLGKRVIFTTSEDSWHGNPEPVKKPRKSIALYFYTKEKPQWFDKQHSTVFTDNSKYL